MKNRIGLEIPVPDLEKGINFYETVFGWKFNRNKYSSVSVYELNGCVQVGIFQSDKVRPKGLNIGIEVESIDATTEKVLLKGGKIVKEKYPYGNEEFVAVFQDCFGNELSLWES
ncbi:MAG: VOC family protein [Candidatus Hodarchaeota archaeon]